MLLDIPGNSKVVIPFSGGLNSFALLNEAILKGCEVLCVYLDFASRKREADVVKKIRHDYGRSADFTFLTLQTEDLLPYDSSFRQRFLSSPDRPTVNNAEVRAYLPNQSLLFLSIAFAYAVENGYSYVAYGASRHDKQINPWEKECEELGLPDTRKQYLQYLEQLLTAGNLPKDTGKGGCSLCMPFYDSPKLEVYEKLDKYGALHYALMNTTSCFFGEDDSLRRIDESSEGEDMYVCGDGSCLGCQDKVNGYIQYKQYLKRKRDGER